MPWALFLAIAAVWTVFLVPGWWVERRLRRLDRVISRAQGQTDAGAIPSSRVRAPEAERPVRRFGFAPSASPRTDRETVLARRRRAVEILAAGVAVTIGWWLWSGYWWVLVLHLLWVAAFVMYIVMLRRLKVFRQDLNRLFQGEVAAGVRPTDTVRVMDRR